MFKCTVKEDKFQTDLREVFQFENIQCAVIGFDWNILQSNQLSRSNWTTVNSTYERYIISMRIDQLVSCIRNSFSFSEYINCTQ